MVQVLLIRSKVMAIKFLYAPVDESFFELEVGVFLQLIAPCSYIF